MPDAVTRLCEELEAELEGAPRWSYWRGVIEDARHEQAKLGKAFDAQSRELEIACEVMTPEQLTEYRHRAYPKLYPRT